MEGGEFFVVISPGRIGSTSSELAHSTTRATAGSEHTPERALLCYISHGREAFCSSTYRWRAGCEGGEGPVAKEAPDPDPSPLQSSPSSATRTRRPSQVRGLSSESHSTVGWSDPILGCTVVEGGRRG